MKTKPISVRLTVEDRAIADSIAHEIGSDIAGAIRYALRTATRPETDAHRDARYSAWLEEQERADALAYGNDE